MTYGLKNIFITLVNVFMTLVLFFLTLRIFFRFFQANAQTPFVAWIYQVSDVFMNPFRGIFPQTATGAGILDVSAIVALVIYTLLVYFITYLLSAVTTRYWNSSEHRHAH